MKKQYIRNYLLGLRLLSNFDVEEILDVYGATLVKVNQSLEDARNIRNEMEDIGWELKTIVEDKNSIYKMWKYDTGSVTR